MDGAHPDEPQLDREHPWPGLVAFNEDARNYFFGRDEEEEELLRRIRREVTTLLFGQSGLGKTSLLQAGLAARLREQGRIPVLVRLSYDADAISPAAQLRRQFREAMEEAAPHARPLGDEETLWEYLHRRDPSPAADGAPPPIPVFLIDQFEEAFTLGLSREESRAGTQQFLSELADLIENRCPAAVKDRLEQDHSLIGQFDFERSDYRIMIAIREDYLSHLDSLRGRAPSLGLNGFRLLRMDGVQALDAVFQPAGGLIEPDVAEDIVRHVARPRPDDPFGAGDADSRPALADLVVDPPVLSLFCNELNTRRIKAGQDQVTANLLDLNKDRILRDFYEKSFRGLPSRLRRFVEDELVTESGLRDSMAFEQAEKRVGRGSRRRAGLNELVRRRLLHVEERSDIPRIELIHDLLAPVVIESRKRRRKSRSRALLGGGFFAILILFAAIYWWQATEDERALQTLRERNTACVRSPMSQICDSLANEDESTLASLLGTDVDATLLALLQVSNARYAAGNIAGSVDLLRKADTLLRQRPEYDFVRPSLYADMAERERRLGDRAAASEHNRLARRLLLQQLPALRNVGSELDGPGLLGDTLSQLAGVDFQLAILDPNQRNRYLGEALSLENARIRLAEEALRGAPAPHANATRRLIFALGSRSWANVLLNRPRDALADVA